MGEIVVHAITKNWGSFSALSDVSIEVKEGEFLSILGPSGCGKSTLLRIIAGLDSPSSGDIMMSGENVTSLPVWKRNIGFVFQNFALWPHLSVFRNLSMGLELRRKAKSDIQKKVADALRLVRMEELAERLPAQLSGGQQQRVALARAIILQPDVLLLDEPLSALDKNLRQDMQVELKAIQQRLGLTTIFVTHDQEEALSLSDRVVIMKRGVVEQIDRPDIIYHHPVSEYVARFVGEAFFFQGVLETTQQGICLKLDNGVYLPVNNTGKPFKEKSKVTAFVRPEWIHLTKTDPKNQTAFLQGLQGLQGIVERRMFFGQSSDYLVRMGEGFMRVKKRPDDPVIENGEKVTIHCTVRLVEDRGWTA